MREQDVFIRAEQALKHVVDQIRDDQWGLTIPSETDDGSDKTLRETVNALAYDDAWTPDVLAGKTAAEVGDKYAGDLLGDDPRGAFAKLNATAQDAARIFDDLDKIVHLSYGDYPAREYLKHITSYRGLSAWDVARLIGADDKLPPDLVQGLWDQIIPEVEIWREMGVFGPEVEVPEDADLQTRLLGKTGRKA